MDEPEDHRMKLPGGHLVTILFVSCLVGCTGVPAEEPDPTPPAEPIWAPADDATPSLTASTLSPEETAVPALEWALALGLPGQGGHDLEALRAELLGDDGCLTGTEEEQTLQVDSTDPTSLVYRTMTSWSGACADGILHWKEDVGDWSPDGFHRTILEGDAFRRSRPESGDVVGLDGQLRDTPEYLYQGVVVDGWSWGIWDAVIETGTGLATPGLAAAFPQGQTTTYVTASRSTSGPRRFLTIDAANQHGDRRWEAEGQLSWDEAVCALEPATGELEIRVVDEGGVDVTAVLVFDGESNCDGCARRYIDGGSGRTVCDGGWRIWP